MAVLKKIIISVGVLIALVVLVGFLLPKEYTVERSILIDAQPGEIYPDVVDLRAWQDWGVWFQRDPSMEIDYTGPDRAIGMKSSWKSASEGKGEMKITDLEHNSKVVYTLMFPEWEMETTGSLELIPSGDATRVTWRDSGDVGNNIISRYFALMMDGMIGPDFEMGLENLKTVVENRG
ncbi:SRPBCC family protein [Alteromonas sp. 1_MG-2023]|uniref:SRPBCC family protein n=1 Tax=Alteromonas sp. 1_MG-2023 TaxID=3062669 RepID=UPI0026E3CFF8|nr:SRPBCC family protein [Alteromonas sp. 1_MG-2023]MDO6567535.1 SRPBCC family protein [Alteromonas sp. 1_MG-2023]